jgi:hypothetical protein
MPCKCPRKVQQPPLSAPMRNAVAKHTSQLVRTIDHIDRATARRIATALAQEGKLNEEGELVYRKKRRA